MSKSELFRLQLQRGGRPEATEVKYNALEQAAIVQFMKEALLEAQFSVKGHCPLCGEDVKHYRNCKIKLALDAAWRYKPRK